MFLLVLELSVVNISSSFRPLLFFFVVNQNNGSHKQTRFLLIVSSLVLKLNDVAARAFSR
jgi:hypothetical protein